jgi:hypothetical protein
MVGVELKPTKASMATPRGSIGPPSLSSHGCGPRKSYITHALLTPHVLSVPSAVFLSLFKGVLINNQD